MTLTQISHRQIQKVYPKNPNDFLLYEDAAKGSIIYDPEAASPLMELRVRFATEDLVGEERLLDIALRHDLDLDLLPPEAPQVPEFAQEFYGFSTEEYARRPFGFMTDLPDRLYEQDKHFQELLLVSLPKKSSCGCRPVDLS